ncbi:cytochrome b5 domain-containing protein [Fusibacter sp. 3D3]|uniref:cytochrome b5 domain-containing protein n=1 Tax=Fusibacter sp. 3D3 TaxID=1048380 RepID=UPI0008532F19|nr:cytochrome b5 domain-containing protein [Fusibacter sp. 3D3]GAU78184.1 hypothetical protein F3D3_2816 [Fusibacter sp. 3D3]
MKKWPLGLMLIFLVSVVLLVACTAGTPTAQVDKSTTESPEATTPEATTPEATTPEATTPEATTPETAPGENNSMNELPVFTLEELAKYNGKEGMSAYVGYEGNVYDVSEIKAWKNGTHQGKYEAGQDLTDVLNNLAPHAPTNLTDNAPIVGTLE